MSHPSPSSAGLEEARAALRRHFGFAQFRPPQRRIIASVLAGRDVLAVLPTGGGKSVCFQVPALIRPGFTLVVSPLISLMQDQVEAARGRGVPAGFINSSIGPGEQRDVFEAAARGQCRIVYVAPERLPRLARDLAERQLRPSLIAVDEAHCISEWGHDFRPSYRRIASARALFGWPQVIALTGSATPAVRADITASLSPADRGGRFVTHLASFDRPNLRFGVERVRDDRCRLAALLRLVRGGPAPVIVYVATRNTSESLARILRHSGVDAAPYHAGLTPEGRHGTLRRFLGGDLGAVVATCAFGMGIDKPDVRQVIHWTMPPTPESYYQEAGRAGRDGRPARCTLLFHPGDPVIHRLQLDVTFPPEPMFEKACRDRTFRRSLPSGVQASVARLEAELGPGGAPVDWRPVRRRKSEALARLRAVGDYARTAACRRRQLIGWFGEQLQRCAGCDRCEA